MLNPNCSVREYLCHKISTNIFIFSLGVYTIVDKDYLSPYSVVKVNPCFILNNVTLIYLVLSTLPYFGPVSSIWYIKEHISIKYYCSRCRSRTKYSVVCRTNCPPNICCEVVYCLFGVN